MKLLLLSAILFSIADVCSGASLPAAVKKDTIIDAQLSSFTKEQFLEKYGRDDSSKALINFFYVKRSTGQGMAGGGGLLSVLAAVGLASAVHKVNTFRGDNIGEDLGYILLALLAAIALAGGVALLSVGIGSWVRYSRKRLLQLLQDYFGGRQIPRGIAKNKIFRSFVQYGEWNAETKKQIKSADLERKRKERNR